MKKRLMAGVVALIGLVAAQEAFGYAKTMYPYEAEGQGAGLGCEEAKAGAKLELGKWYTNFAVVKKYAEDNGIPMLAVWSNHGCIHCWYTDVCFIQDSFKAWKDNNNAGQILYCFMAGGEKGLPDQEGSPAYNWMYRSQKSYPFVALYWKANGKVLVEKRMTGDQFCEAGGSKLSFTDDTIPTRVANITKTLEKEFADWTPSVYPGGYFAVSEDDPLQVEPTTKSLYVPLYRKETEAVTQPLTITRTTTKLLTATSGSVDVKWAEGVTNMVFEIPNFGKNYYSAGGRIALQMSNVETGDLMSSTVVECVAAQENSAVNPYWIGERTASTLAAGEWTMDLDVALKRTAAQKGDAYTMVYFTGALWCPWCRGLDHYVMQDKTFTSLVKEKNVALVCLDNLRRGPYDNFGGTNETMSVNATPSGKAPSLLSYESGVSGNGTASGTSYLSRKGIAPADAQSILQRNLDLGYVGGAYATPDSYRTGYPTVVLLDKAGKVVGRWEAVSGTERDEEKRYIYDTEDSIARLKDLFANASEKREAGRYAATATDSLQIGLVAEVELSVNAPEQVLKIENLPSGKVSFRIDENESGASIALSLLKLEEYPLVRKDGEGKVVKSENVTMPVEVDGSDTGAAFIHEFSSEEAKGTFVLKVSAGVLSADTKPFKVSVGSSPLLIPGETVAEYTPNAGQVSLEVVAGEVYRLSGSWKDLETGFTKGEEDGLWIAGETRREILAVTAGSKIYYQLWHPGEVGFKVASRSEDEGAGTVAVAIERTGGVSGDVTVSVSLDKDKTDLYDSDGRAKFEFKPFTYTWKEGDSTPAAANIKVLDDVRYDDAGKVTLVLTKTAGAAELGTSVFVLNVSENDKQSPGKAAFIGADPLFAAKSTVYAKASAGAVVKIGRLEASDGAVSVKVSSSLPGVALSGDIEDGVVSWGTHKFEEKSVKVAGIAAGKTAKLTLGSPTGGLKVLSASNTVTVVSVPDSAPQFTVPAASVALCRYVATSNVFALADAPSGRMTFTKTSGSLPAGLKVSYDAEANALALTGATTAKAGEYKVVYRAKDGSVAGLTLELTLTVADPSDAAAAESGAGNPAIAVTRTFKNVPVVNDVNHRLAGVLQVTIPPKGNVSAKYLCEWGTISFSTKNWSSFDAESKDMVASLSSATRGYSLEVIAQADGGVNLVVTDPHYEDVSLDAEVDDSSLWSKENPASAWKGYYTVALAPSAYEESEEGFAPRGCGYLTLKMNTTSAVNAGSFTWAGLLPDGTAVSGTSVMTYGEEWGVLPIFKASSTDALSVMSKVLAGGYEADTARSVLSVDNVKAYWEHVERDEEAEADYIVDLGVYGGPYLSTSDLADCCEEAYETTSPTALFDTSKLSNVSYGEIVSSPTATVTVVPTRLSLASGSPAGMTLSLNRSTGIVSGSVRLPLASGFVTAQWKGVILQGWGPGCTDCGPGGAQVTYRPFINGAYYFRESRSYTTTAGRKKTVSVKRGGDVSVQ